jgi:hypothetical protein
MYHGPSRKFCWFKSLTESNPWGGHVPAALALATKSANAIENSIMQNLRQFFVASVLCSFN